MHSKVFIWYCELFILVVMGFDFLAVDAEVDRSIVNVEVSYSIMGLPVDAIS